MKRFLTVLLTGMMLCIFFCSAGEAETELYGYALQKLATRDGPGTTYRETGTYNDTQHASPITDCVKYNRSKCLWRIRTTRIITGRSSRIL